MGWLRPGSARKGPKDQAGAGCGHLGRPTWWVLGRTGEGQGRRKQRVKEGSWEKGREVLLTVQQAGRAIRFYFGAVWLCTFSGWSLWGCATDGRRARGRDRAQRLCQEGWRGGREGGEPAGAPLPGAAATPPAPFLCAGSQGLCHLKTDCKSFGFATFSRHSPFCWKLSGHQTASEDCWEYHVSPQSVCTSLHLHI